MNWAMKPAIQLFVVGPVALLSLLAGGGRSAESWGQTENRFATSENQNTFVHWIELYDAQNNKILPDSRRPYSPLNTCGRCHEYDTIAHGFHFQAGLPDLQPGRPGQPWVWSDERTGTHLPLSYRDWPGTWHPDQLGLTRWQMAARFGGYLPGGGPGSAEVLEGGPRLEPSDPRADVATDRTRFTGPLPVDCMMCHHRSSSGYDPSVWTEQVQQENFAYAPVAALGLGNVAGSIRRLRDDFDPTGENAADQLPQVDYHAARFRPDGKVFFDLQRKPDNNACYYCHTQTPLTSLEGQRWLHDQDVHVRAGMACADCHRNGLDHQTVRGYVGEQHVGGSTIAALSCQGCHLGTSGGEVDDAQGTPLTAMAGRMGAPRPLHRGIPPIHFEKMSCTACHSGPLPGPEAQQQLYSIIHQLGQDLKRKGPQQPAVLAPVHLPVGDTGSWIADRPDGVANSTGVYTPHHMMWPAFWGTLEPEGGVQPLHPELAAAWIRRPLRVRREFTNELQEIRLSLSQRREAIGAERAQLPEDQWTAEEKQQLQEMEQRLRSEQIEQRISESLLAIQAEMPDRSAVYVSGGVGYVLDEDGVLEIRDAADLGSGAGPYAWPLAHNVRPAAQSLGVKGCAECHADDAAYFQMQVTGVGTVPDQPVAQQSVNQWQGTDPVLLASWNQLFQGRALFKIGSIVALSLVGLLILAAAVSHILGIWRKI